MKLRAILDYKRLDYQRINPLGPALRTIHRRGRIGKVPAVVIDGEWLVDSTDIAYQLDRRFPDPPIIPASPKDRGLCHAIEEWADESLYFIGLYYQWYEPAGRAMVPRAFGKSLLGRVAYRVYLHRILGQLKGQGTLRKPPDHVRADLDRHLGAVEAMIEPGPFVFGDAPILCDFALFGQLAYLARTPVAGTALKARPALLGYIERMRPTAS